MKGFFKNLTSGSRYVAVSEEHRGKNFLISKRIQSTKSMAVYGAIQDWYDKFCLIYSVKNMIMFPKDIIFILGNISIPNFKGSI